jgi:hypothetical protein
MLIRIGSTALHLSVVGRVPQDFASMVLSELVNVYRLFGEGPELVEVYIYESSELMHSYMFSEAVELGVSVFGQHVVSHDAWRGWPRIHIDYSACKNLEEKFLKALIHHEVAHSVLHGTLQSYVIALPRNFAELFEKSPGVVYLASVAIKDVEVAMYLTSKGLKNSVESYLEYTKKEFKGIHCKTVEEVLQLAKLIAPCTAIKCDVGEELEEECKAVYPTLLEILNKVSDMKIDLSLKIGTLLEEITMAIAKQRKLF